MHRDTETHTETERERGHADWLENVHFLRPAQVRVAAAGVGGSRVFVAGVGGSRLLVVVTARGHVKQNAWRLGELSSFVQSGRLHLPQRTKQLLWIAPSLRNDDVRHDAPILFEPQLAVLDFLDVIVDVRSWNRLSIRTHRPLNLFPHAFFRFFDQISSFLVPHILFHVPVYWPFAPVRIGIITRIATLQGSARRHRHAHVLAEPLVLRDAKTA